MRTVHLNGSDRAVAAETVAALIEELAIPGAPRGLAVAVNGSLVPRSEWPARPLAPGDAIEIVRATRGG
ncbi:MAG TPA: sulfur carrier protein ThiS [Stellaceae bacterium]|nr:sulfur carrier protein ThiS [Stellaceae bacterium]